MFFAPHTLKRG